MRIIALLAIRNEELYLERCLSHLRDQGIETYVIDNESTDRSMAIAKSFSGRGVIGIEQVPYRGVFDLFSMLRRKEKLARSLRADWFLHHDADEIREAPLPYPTLHDGIAAAHKAGYNAINFDEFVFCPEAEDCRYEHSNYVETMRHYYYFDPVPLHRVNAWRKRRKVDLVTCGGHQAAFKGRRVFPINFVLRHYILLSAEHGRRKYSVERRYSPEEIEQRRWHGWRGAFEPHMLKLPPASALKRYHGDRQWDRSQPWREHIFIRSAAAVLPTAPG